MPDWSKSSEYVIRLLFLVLAVASVGSAIFLVGSGTGLVVLIIIGFFSLLITARYQNLRVELGDYVLDFNDNLSEGYDGLIEHTKVSSSLAAQSLQEVRRHARSGDPFHDLSRIIDIGIKNRNKSPPDQLLSNLKVNISSKIYIESFSETDMKVVRLQDYEIYVNSGDKSNFLKTGMKFRIYRKTLQISNDTAEDITDSLGVASVVLASKGTTKLKMEQWTVPIDNQEVVEIRNNDLKGKKLYADILIPESVKETPIQELKEAYQQLKPIRTEP